MILLLVLLQLKHFVLDFTRLQPPWMFLNKGTYGHPGGIVHALGHAVATWFIVLVLGYGPTHAAVVLLAELVTHYHMDWFKVWWNKRRQWSPLKDPAYWTLLGFDQLVHQLTYVWILWYLS